MDNINIKSLTPVEKLLESRKVFLNTVIDDISVNDIISKFLYLDLISSEDIDFFINSPGGSITSGLAVYDIMKSLKSDVRTICLGQASSMAQVLLTSGTRGKRFAYPHAQIMMHQPMGTISGQVSDIQIQMMEIQKLKMKLSEITAIHSGQPLARVIQDAERDFYFSVDEAVSYGLVDGIINLKNIPAMSNIKRTIKNGKNKNNKYSK